MEPDNDTEGEWKSWSEINPRQYRKNTKRTFKKIIQGRHKSQYININTFDVESTNTTLNKKLENSETESEYKTLIKNNSYVVFGHNGSSTSVDKTSPEISETNNEQSKTIRNSNTIRLSEEVCELIVNYRKNLKFTQEDMSIKCNISLYNYQKYEQQNDVDIVVFKKIREVLNFTEKFNIIVTNNKKILTLKK
jgi:hypothetical protein